MCNMKKLLALLALFALVGCVNVTNKENLPVLLKDGRISDMILPFNDNPKTFVLYCKPASSTLGSHTIFLWEDSDGFGHGLDTWVAEISSAGILEIYWRINKTEWERMCKILSNNERIREAELNLLNQDKSVTTDLDGILYVFSGYSGKSSSHFPLFVPSKYAGDAELTIINTITDSVPICPELDLPTGCLYVYTRKRDEKGKVISESKYWP